jgi:gamma-glutamylaminecyclotransferase
MPIRVFVYGSLKQGKGNHRLLEQSKFLGRCMIEGPHRMISLGGYPGLVRKEDLPPRKIVGEVYQVNEETLQSLDWLEGHPRFYERHKVETPFKNAWVYYLPEGYLDRHPDAGQIWQSSEEERAWFTGAITDA